MLKQDQKETLINILLQVSFPLKDTPKVWEIVEELKREEGLSSMQPRQRYPSEQQPAAGQVLDPTVVATTHDEQ